MSDLMYMVCKSGYSVLLPERENYELSEKQMHTLQENWGKVEYKGELSKQTSRRIAHLLEIWFRVTRIANSKLNLLNSDKKKQLVFITLTLSARQMHTDNEVKRNMLNAFIIDLSRSYNMINYLWKAEKQKNGNIHFHIITDVFINKNDLNYTWDKIQYNNGYVEKSPIKSNDYASPSTRIEVVHESNGVASYMGKYMSKEDGFGKIQGRCWGASKEIKNLKDLDFELDSELEVVLQTYINTPGARYNIGDFFCTFGMDFFFMIHIKCPRHRSRINIWYSSLYLQLYGESNHFDENELVRDTKHMNDYK